MGLINIPCKAGSTPATMWKQRSTLFDFVEATFDFVAKNGNNVERVYRKIRPFAKVERCFDIVAGVDGA